VIGMNKLLKYFIKLFRRSAENKKAVEGDLVVRAQQGSTWAVKHYGKAIEKLAEYDKSN